MTPARWVTDHVHLIPHGGRVLDVACGRGRHAQWLAAHGFAVHAADRDVVAIEALREEAVRHGWPIDAEVRDLEAGASSLPARSYAAIVVVHYLHRPLFPQLLGALAPGGVLIYETFTVAQARRGKPTNPAFLLEPGELVRLVAPCEVVASREGEFEGRDVASVVARLRA